MREISPAVGMTADEFLAIANTDVQVIAARIRAEKAAGARARPSTSLVDQSQVLRPSARRFLLDAVAELVDENLFGRAEMCVQFADLLQRALAYVGVSARSALGEAIYYVDGREVFRWQHAWVRVGDEVVDGNVDALSENPVVPAVVRIAPYWGPIRQIPSDRRLRESNGDVLPGDDDVSRVWWPDLKRWLDCEFATL